MAAVPTNPVITSAPLTFPFPTLDPFLRCSYNKDNYPPGDAAMKPPREGTGHEFAPQQPWRMYAGKEYPGFPRHPHKGYEVLTFTMEGVVDHADSMGNGGRYGNGDVQWMTAGRGIEHSETFPLMHPDRPNFLRLFQIWMNLPAHAKSAEPSFLTYWSNHIPQLVTGDGKAKVTVWVGSLLGSKGCSPPYTSWANDPSHEVGAWLITLAPGGTFTVPASREGTNRMAYFVEGQSLKIASQSIPFLAAIHLHGHLPAPIKNTGTEAAQVLVLQGQPLKEPLVQHGAFALSHPQEIPAAVQEYEKTKFGKWPWPTDAHVFPKYKGQFALIGGREYNPP